MIYEEGPEFDHLTRRELIAEIERLRLLAGEIDQVLRREIEQPAELSGRCPTATASISQ
jgi:hypothetical protein